MCAWNFEIALQSQANCPAKCGNCQNLPQLPQLPYVPACGPWHFIRILLWARTLYQDTAVGSDTSSGYSCGTGNSVRTLLWAWTLYQDTPVGQDTLSRHSCGPGHFLRGKKQLKNLTKVSGVWQGVAMVSLKKWCGSGSGSTGSNNILVEAEAPKNMPPPLPLCFKVAVQILVDFC
jgi:hypothetical protein